MTNTKTNELITLKDASTILEATPTEIRRKFINKGLLDAKYVNDGRASIIRVYRDQVMQLKEELRIEKETQSPYGELHLDIDESIKLMDCINNPRAIVNPLRYATISKYAVSNKGRIINLTHNRVLTPQTVDHGYLQIVIGDKFELVHVAVGLQWCPNGKCKKQLHHIDGNKANNHAINLVWVTVEEHRKAHKLLSTAKDSGNWDEYNQYIANIIKDNEWREDMRVIFDPYDSSENGYIHAWFVTDSGYCDFKKGVRTWDDMFTDGEIRGEWYCC